MLPFVKWAGGKDFSLNFPYILKKFPLTSIDSH